MYPDYDYESLPESCLNFNRVAMELALRKYGVIYFAELECCREFYEWVVIINNKVVTHEHVLVGKESTFLNLNVYFGVSCRTVSLKQENKKTLPVSWQLYKK